MYKKVNFSPYTPWRPLGLREVEAPTFSDIRLIDDGKVVSPTRRPLFTPRTFPGTHFCWRLSRPQGHSAAGRIIHIFLTSALVGGEWSTSRPGRFTPGERAPGNHWIGGCVDLRAGLDDLEKRKFLTLPGLELRPPRFSSP
jgi:hypothetical protein